MPARFTALASGSAGNACLIQAGRCGVLLDFGLGPRTLASRMASRGLGWRHVTAALLTHTHTDHWNETTLVYLKRLAVPLFCHPTHVEALNDWSDAFRAL